MPAPRYRSRTLRRRRVRTPGGSNVLRYAKRKPAKAKCAACGTVLAGVYRARARQLHHIAKTKKRPQRPYGGMFCSSCARKALIEHARGMKL